MLGSLANAWKVPELRQRLLFTAALLAAYRLGAFVPLPGLSREAIATGIDTSQNAITGLFGVFTGGAFNNLAVAYEQDGQLQKAREAYEKALALEPENALVRQNYDLFKEINDRAAQKDGR